MKLSDGEKLIVIMLADLLEANGVKGEIDPSFVKGAICSGDAWALKWEYHGLFHDEQTDEKVAREAASIMTMCSVLEYSISQLSKPETAQLKRQGHVFVGFDGNNETEHFGVASVLVEDMGRFGEFKGRSLNSHMPMLDRYRRMKLAFEGVGGAGASPLPLQMINAVLDA